MTQKFLWIFLFIALLSVVRGQSGRRGTIDSDDRRNPTETNSFGTNSDNQWNSQRPNQLSGNGEEDRGRPNQRPFGSFDHVSNNRETEHGGFLPNTQSSSSQRPNQQLSSGHTSNRDTEYNRRQNQNQSGSRESDRDGPNHQFSSGHTDNRETEYNQRPNHQQSGDRDRPNQPFGSFGQVNNNRETAHGGNLPNGQSFSSQRPNEQQFGSVGHGSNNPGTEYTGNRPNQQSSGSTNNRETEFSQRPDQQGSIGQSGSGDRPGGNQYAQRPPSMGSIQPEGGKPLCYGFFGCFSQSEPWTSKLRPVPAPLPPENNSASFFFYSRPTIEQRFLINVYPEFSLGEAKFDPRRPTVVIIHGFIQDGNIQWMEEMKNAYLRHVDANAIIVDWGKGSRRLSYLQAAGNTRLIGSMLSYLIKRLMEGHGADPANFHLIGHSLGAHVASYAAKEVPGIGRLTALDPAQPGFEGYDKSVRLDKSDAQFVDVVHTNAKPFIPTLGLGMIKPHGHVDFYMNGGSDQPLCVAPSKFVLNDIKSILDLANLPIDWFSQTFFCDHSRAFSYLIEAFNNTDCVFWGHKANLKNVAQGVANSLTQGLLGKYVALSSSCSRDDCIPLGFDTHLSPLRGSFVATTNGRYPYCRPERNAPSQRSDTNTSNIKNI